MPKNTDYYLNLAKKNGMKVRSGGKHWKIEAIDQNGNRSVMMIPREVKATGTEHAIRKWFIRMGVLLALLVTVTSLLMP